MDTAVSNGDFLCNSKGTPINLAGYEELLQRVLIRLTVKKGSFVYDKSLGSRLYTLKATDGNIKERALALVREALIEIPEVAVNDVKIALTNDKESLELTVILAVNNTEKEVVMTI